MVKGISDYKISSSPSRIKADQKFIVQMLKNHTFVGNYIEQRYVPDLQCYRKIIKISNTADTFIENLLICKKKIDKCFGYTKWVGFTTPNTAGAPAGFNLWVDIDQEVFGTYQFNVSNVIFTEREILIELTSLQSYQDENIMGVAGTKLKNSMKEVMNLSTFREAVFFLFLLVTAIIAGTGKLLMIILDYSLKFLAEFNNTLKVLTPVFIACIETISKMFGYICFMLASLFNRQTQNNQRIYYRADYPYRNQYRALPYNGGSSVQITEIAD